MTGPLGESSAELERSVEWLRSARHVVVFTGAGVSAESGIATFRDQGGLWQRFPAEEFATWRGIFRTAVRRPRLLVEFLAALLEPVARAEPNAAHRAIAALERFVPTTVITQNVDRLHQDAGSTTVREIHGSLFEVVNVTGRFVRLISRREMRGIAERLHGAESGPFRRMRAAWALHPLAGLSVHGGYRPRVVLFGERLIEPDWAQAQEDARACDVLLVVGTSAMVWPAAELPHEARAHGAKVIAVDPEPPPAADAWLRGTACEILPALVRAAFGSTDS